MNSINLNLDSRPCREKIQGPLYYDSNVTQAFHSRVADENNTLTLRCRVICQEDGAYYTPHIRIITTKDGVVYDRRKKNFFSTDQSPSLIDPCDTANRIQDYEFRITAHNTSLNESIATCVLFYRSVAESSFTEYCYTPSLVWIVLPNRPTTMPPTAITPPTTPIYNITTKEITFPEEPAPTLEIRYIGKIPDGVSIPFIIAALVGIVVVALIAVVWFVHKRFSKTRKRRISSQPLQDGSAIRRPHGGFYTTEDMESAGDARTGQHAMSNLTLRH